MPVLTFCSKIQHVVTETYFHSLRLCSSAAHRYPLDFFLIKHQRLFPWENWTAGLFPSDLMCSSILTHRTPLPNKEHIKVKDLRIHSDSPNCHDLFLLHSCLSNLCCCYFHCRFYTHPHLSVTTGLQKQTAVTCKHKNIQGSCHDILNWFTVWQHG